MDTSSFDSSVQAQGGTDTYVLGELKDLGVNIEEIYAAVHFQGLEA